MLGQLAFVDVFPQPCMLDGLTRANNDVLRLHPFTVQIPAERMYHLPEPILLLGDFREPINVCRDEAAICDMIVGGKIPCPRDSTCRTINLGNMLGRFRNGGRRRGTWRLERLRHQCATGENEHVSDASAGAVVSPEEYRATQVAQRPEAQPATDNQHAVQLVTILGMGLERESL